jgi:hypothetical protein
VESTGQSVSAENSTLVEDARSHVRFKLQVAICIYCRDAAVVRGDTVDIGETGISAILREEVPLGEVVRVTFSVPAGDVEILALVRQRTAFRYGFQFMEGGPASALIRRTCRELSLQESLQVDSQP